MFIKLLYMIYEESGVRSQKNMANILQSMTNILQSMINVLQNAYGMSLLINSDS